MTVQPLVSVLVPVFNREHTLSECLESALKQTYTNLEIIIVDNASTDGTWALCEQFAQRDARVHIFRNDSNIGPVRNWQRCLDEARGEYGKILFSDDTLEPGCVAAMLPPLLNNDDAAFSYCATYVGKTRSNAAVVYDTPGEALIPARQYLNLVITDRAPVSPGAMLFRLTDLRQNLQIDFPTATRREYSAHGAGPDMMLALGVLRHKPLAAHILPPQVFFRAHAGSFTTGAQGQQVRDSYRSVLAWFIRETYGYSAWLNYIALEWLRAFSAQKKPVRLKQFLTQYEGTGSLGEQCSMALKAATHVAGKLINTSKVAQIV